MALIGVAGALAAFVGVLAGARSWAVFVGLAAGFLLLVGWLERVWLRSAARREVDRELRRRTSLRVIPGGKDPSAPDQNDDDDSNEPRWLM
jgi:hypothetical protein